MAPSYDYAAKCAAAANTIAHAATSIDNATATAWVNFALVNRGLMQDQQARGDEVPLHRDAENGVLGKSSGASCHGPAPFGQVRSSRGRSADRPGSPEHRISIDNGRIFKMSASRFSRRAAALLFALTALPPFLMAAAGAEPSPADALVGVWEADDGTVKLDMYKAGSEFQARMLYGNEIVESDNVTFKKDTRNPDPTLRSRSLKNIVFVTGLRWTDGEWSGGSIYDGSSGRTYNCRAIIQDGKMHLRGYLGLPAMGQTRILHRVRG